MERVRNAARINHDIQFEMNEASANTMIHRSKSSNNLGVKANLIRMRQTLAERPER